MSVAVFIADVSTDWYLAGNYLSVSTQKGNILDQINLEFSSSACFKNKLSNYEEFCKNVLNKEDISGRILTPNRFYIFRNNIDLKKILDNSKNTSEIFLYEFIHQSMISSLFDRIFIGDDVEVLQTYYCDTAFNYPDKFNELLHVFKKPVNCHFCKDKFYIIFNIDCEKYVNKSKNDFFEIYKNSHQIICDKLFWPKELFERILYEFNKIKFESALPITGSPIFDRLKKKLLNDKKLLDMDIYRYLNTTMISGISPLYSWFYRFKNYINNDEVDLVQITYERKYWYSKFGIAIGLTMLLATLANLRLKLW